MNNPEIYFTVKSVNGCPLYREGDYIKFSLPAITASGTGKVCSNLVHDLHPKCVAISCGADFVDAGLNCSPEFPVLCPGCRLGNKVSLTVTLKKPGPAKPRPSDSRTGKFIKVLKQIPLFKPLPESSITQIVGYMSYKKFNNGDVILKQGEPGQYLFIIIGGEVEVVQLSKFGDETHLATLRSNECFGEMSIISGEPVSATVRAVGTVSTLRISKDFLAKTSESNVLNIYFNKLFVQRMRKQNRDIEKALSDGVKGNLKMISLPELAQTLNMNHRTGILKLYQDDTEAEIFFVNGHVYDTKLGKQTGEEAFYKILTWKTGDFNFLDKEPKVNRKIITDTMGLLMEGLRRADEEGAEAPDPADLETRRLEPV